MSLRQRPLAGPVSGRFGGCIWCRVGDIHNQGTFKCSPDAVEARAPSASSLDMPMMVSLARMYRERRIVVTII